MADYSEVALVRSLNYLAETQGSIAHNLANASSTAYKRRVGIAQPTESFGSHLGGMMPTLAYRETSDTSDGTLRATGQGLHVALQGDGYFRVRRADGGNFLTRSGELLLDQAGNLVTPNGDRYLGADGNPINLSADGVPPAALRISPDGTISDGRDASLTLGQLGIVTVDRPATLRPAGNSLFVLPPGMETKTSAASVQQHHLEQSNVDSLSELINMMIVQRSFEATSRTLRTVDQLQSAFVTAMNR